MKTAELTGPALAWAVGIAEGYELSLYGVEPSIRARIPGLGVHAPWAPHSYWSQGGPIIEREFIELACFVDTSSAWNAMIREADQEPWQENGDTALIAAMRCYVASKLGDDVDIPQELTGTTV